MFFPLFLFSFFQGLQHGSYWDIYSFSMTITPVVIRCCTQSLDLTKLWQFVNNSFSNSLPWSSGILVPGVSKSLGVITKWLTGCCFCLFAPCAINLSVCCKMIWVKVFKNGPSKFMEDSLWFFVFHLFIRKILNIMHFGSKEIIFYELSSSVMP